MAKQLLNYENGLVLVTEDQGKISLHINGQLGGGSAAGIVAGQGSITLDGELGLKLAIALLNAHLPPALLPIAQLVENAGLAALKAVE